MFQAVRVRIVAALALALACGGAMEQRVTDPPPGTVRAKVLLTDAPFPYDSVARVDLHILKVEASASADTGGSAGGAGGEWVTLAAPDRSYNLLELTQGLAVEVGAGTIPAGTYRAIRLTIDTERTRLWARYAVDATNAPRAGFGAIAVDWQSSRGQPALYALVENPVAVSGTDAEIVIDFDVGRSFICEAFCSRFIFSPVFRAVNRAATGAIEGRVLGDTLSTNQEPIPNTSVTVFDGDLGQPEGTWRVAATGKTDAQGNFRIAFLPPDRYILRADAPRESPYTAGVRAYVNVTEGQTTSGVTITLPTQNLEALAITGLGGALEPGQTGQILVYARSISGNPAPPEAVTFESSNPAVATVAPCLVTMSSCRAPAGIVHAKSVGVTTITVRYGSLTRTTNVSVESGGTGVPVGYLSLTPRWPVIPAGDSAIFTATTYSPTGQVLAGRLVQWTVSDPAVASVHRWSATESSRLVVRGLAVGSAIVTATAEGRSLQMMLTVGPAGSVVDDTSAVATVEVGPGDRSLRVGDSLRFYVLARDAAGKLVSGGVPFFSTQHPLVATVDTASGLTRARAVGTATIRGGVYTASKGWVFGTTELRVVP